MAQPTWFARTAAKAAWTVRSDFQLSQTRLHLVVKRRHLMVDVPLVKTVDDQFVERDPAYPFGKHCFHGGLGGPKDSYSSSLL